MTPEAQTFFLQDFTALLIKGFMLVLILLYVIFSAVLLRQVQLMNKVVTLANFSPVLILITLLHLFASIGLFIFALIML